MDALFLSPHLDDAVLSCGGQIHRRTARGERVEVLTLFAGGAGPGAAPSRLAATLYRAMGLDANEAAEVRRREDLEACRRLGARAAHLSFLECIERRDGAGEPFYHEWREIFGEPKPEDRGLVPELAAALGEHSGAVEVFAPLGAGGHVDHLLARWAAEAVWGEALRYYEELPYARKRRAVRRARKRLTAERGLRGLRDPAWRSEVQPLSEEDLQAKVEVVAAYASQIRPIFGSEAKMARALRRHARRVGGERWWGLALHPARAFRAFGLRPS